MTEFKEVEVYKRLLARTDAWAKQAKNPDARGRFPYFKQVSPVTQELIEQSLATDDVTIGAYCINNRDNTVRNPQIDIDNHDGKTDVKKDAMAIYDRLVKIGAHPYIEASGGTIENGAHAGIIAQPTPAKDAKALLELVLNSLKLNHEVFPKQVEIDETGFGNLVKLPFQFNNRVKARSEIVDPTTFQPLPRDKACEFMLSLPDTDILALIPEAKKENQSDVAVKSIANLLTKIGSCFAEAYTKKWNLSGEGGDRHRLYAATELILKGATDEEIHEYFKVQTDYSPEITQEKIDIRRATIQKKGVKPTKCATIKRNLDINPALCINCPRKQRGTHPDAASGHIERAVSKFRAPSVFELAEEMQTESPIYYDRSGNFWLWVVDHYERIDETDLLLALRRIIDDEKKILGNAKSAILDAIRITGRARDIKEPPKTWIHLKDAVIDIKTGEWIKPSPEYLLTASIPHKLGPSTDTPTIDLLFTQWVGTEKKKLLYELLAYCILDDYPIHRLFVLFGRGRNGKGQFKEIVLRLVGLFNVTATTLEGLIHSRFESARLYKKKVATIGETNFSLLEDTAIFKMATGGDLIPAEFKNKKPFEFYNTAKIIINTNSLPPTTDKTDAYYSRFIIVEFPNQFQKGKDIVDIIPAEEYDNLVAKCIQVLKELLEKGEFTGEGDILEKAQRYEAFSNPLNEYISDRCNKDVNAITPLWHFNEQFKEYLASRGLRIYSDPEIRKLLETNGYELKPNHVFKEFIKNGQWTGIVGISIKNNPYLPQNTPKPQADDGENTLKGPQKEPERATENTPKCSEPRGGVQTLQKDDQHAEKGRLDSLDILDYSHSVSLYKELSTSTPKPPNAPNFSVTESVEKAGKEWEQLKGRTIDISNIIEFCGWYYEQKDKSADPSEIKAVVEHIFKVTPTVAPAYTTVRALCDICKAPLNGNHDTEQGLPGQGIIHTACKYLPIQIKFLVDTDRPLVGIDKREYGAYKKGDIASLPAYNASALIHRKAAVRVEAST